GPSLLGLDILRWIGAAMIPVGAALYLAGVTTLGRSGCNPLPPVYRIVSNGVYAWTRNPMYVGGLTAVVGQGLLFGRGVLRLHAVGWFTLFHLFEVTFDEKVLARQFGAVYTDYCASTPRWIPRRPGR